MYVYVMYVYVMFVYVMYEHVRPRLRHLLLCQGSNKEYVYLRIYYALRRSGVGGGKAILIFPNWMKEIVRLRFDQNAKDIYCYTNAEAVYTIVT